MVITLQVVDSRQKMSEINKFDPEALLENVDGWILNVLKEELAQSGAWKKFASLCVNAEGKEVFSQSDLNKISSKNVPAEAFLDELLKRNVTMKCLCSILEKAELNEILKQIGIEEKAEIINQSMTGLEYVAVGEEITIKINVSGIPTPSLQWYKGESPLPQYTSSSLRLREFCVGDEGIYLCLVRQLLRDKEVLLWSSPIQLCVRETPPHFVQHPTNSNEIVEGEMLDLQCIVEGYPPPVYTWVKDGEAILSGSQEPRVQIDCVRLSDGGIYRCYANNYLGETESNPISVMVRPKGRSSNVPQIIRHPTLCEEKPERSIGQTLVLVCSARCTKNVIFTWVVNGRTVDETQSSRHIIMSSVTPPDFSSSLSYTVGEDNGSSVKILCIVRSADACQYSNELKLKVTSKDCSIEYFAGTKWALLIANTDYNIDPLPPLFTPASDMEQLARELAEMSFHCLMLTNLNLVELRNSVKFFSSLIKPGDYVVFCYAGHGLFSGIDLLMPVPNHNSTTELETLSSVWVRSMLQKNDPALLFIVLDMCRHIHHSPIKGLDTLVKSPAKRNCVILNATTEGYQSLEDPKKSSVLTSSLVKHLKDKVDLVTMAKSILRDVAHMSPYVRSEQIPKLDVNLCDNRSLTDPQKVVDGQIETIWASIVELPQNRVAKVMVDGKEICIHVSCFLGGNFQFISNVVHLQLEVMCEGIPPTMSLAFTGHNNRKQIFKTHNKVVYEIRAIHQIKEPLSIIVAFRNKANELTQEVIELGLPGIAKVKLFNEVFEPSFRARNANYNIP